MSEDLTPATTASILVFSDDATIRRDIVTAIEGELGEGLPKVVCKEVATPEMVMIEAEENDYALMILDAEAPKFGGMGLGKMVQDEVTTLPFILYIARPQDEWLARWSGAKAILSYPVNPRELSAEVAAILRG